MMHIDEKQQVIGLAATIQSLLLVNQIATKGQFDREAAEPIINALFIYSPDDALAAYGDSGSNLSLGITALEKMLKAQQMNDVTGYLLNVINVENKLVKNTKLLTTLRDTCKEISLSCSQAPSNFDPLLNNDENNETITDSDLEKSVINNDVSERLADLYKHTASTVEPRIMINGDAQYLRDLEHANWIRAFLLASMRGAGFFRHYGGSRVNILMKRSTYLEELNKI